MLKIEYIKASELKPNPNNAKLHPDSQIAQIVRSIKEYGMDDPIAVWGEDNTIIEGHGRLLACHIMANNIDSEVSALCAIGDDNVVFTSGNGKNIAKMPYNEVIAMAKGFIEHLGGFEKLAEWGLF